MSLDTIDILLPDFFSSLALCPAGANGHSSSLMLSKGDFSNVSVAGYESKLREWFSPSCAAVEPTYRADLLYFEAGISDVIATPLPPDFHLSEASRSLIETRVNEFLLPIGGRYVLHSSGVGDLHLEDPDLLTDIPPSSIWGKGIRGHVRRLDPDGSNRWAKLFTELQMLLHGLIHNEFDDVTEFIPNGIWFWHGYDDFSVSRSGFDDVLSCDLELARLDERVRVLSTSSEWASLNGRVLLVWDRMQRAMTDEGRYQSFEELEACVLEPLLNQLQQGKVNEIKLHFLDGRELVLKRRHLRKFWRRTKPIQHYLPSGQSSC